MNNCKKFTMNLSFSSKYTHKMGDEKCEFLKSDRQALTRTGKRRLPKSKSNVPLNKAYTFTALSRSKFLPKNSQFWLLWLLFGYFIFHLFLLSTVFPSCQLSVKE